MEEDFRAINRKKGSKEAMQRLFDYFVVVGLQYADEMDSPSASNKAADKEKAKSSGGRRQLVPFVKYKFPAEGESSKASSLEFIKDFCFPDVTNEEELDVCFPSSNKRQRRHNSDTFSFVLTDLTGGKRWGYCRRFVPLFGSPSSSSFSSESSSVDGSTADKKKKKSKKKNKERVLPQCFCLLSFTPCFSIFSKILDEVMRLGEQGLPSEQEFVCLCSQLLGRLWEEAMPKPAQRIAVWVNLHAPSLNELRCYTFMRPDEHSDSLLEHVDFGPLLRHLDADNVLAVFASLLVERRIIFVADGVSTLSACVQAMVALLYPFSWQHVFIPVLPRSMLTYCCAPMPFVVGVLRSAVPELRAMSDSMEDVVLIDIDNNKYIAPPTIQDTEFMPPATVGPLHDIIDVHRRAILAKLPSTRQHQSQPLTRKTKSKSVGSLFAAAATQFNPNSNNHNHNNAALDAEEQSLAGADDHNDVKEENKKEMPREAMQNLANGFVAFMVDLLASYRSFIISPSERERQRQEQLMQLPPEERVNAHIVVDCFDRINFVASQPIELQPILHFLTQTQLFQTFIEERTTTSDSGKFEKGVNRESLRRTKKIRPRLKSSSFSTRQASSIPSVPSPLSSSATPKTSLDSGSEDPSSPVSLTNFPNFSRSSTFTTTYRLNDPPVLGGAFSSSSFAAATSAAPSSSQAINVPSSKKTQQALHVWSKGEVSRQGITSTASATIGLSPPSPPSLHRAFQPPPPTPQLQPQPQIQAKPPPQPQPLQQRRSSFHASVRKAFRLSPKRETTSEMGALLTILLSQEPKQNEGTGNETIGKPGAYSSTVMNIFEPNTWKIKNRPLCADGPSCREDNPYHWIEYRHTPIEEEDDHHLSEEPVLEDAPPHSEARTDNYLQILEYLSRQHLKNGET